MEMTPILLKAKQDVAMAQEVKSLPTKHTDITSNSSTMKDKKNLFDSLSYL
jgi:hypothetical protein